MGVLKFYGCVQPTEILFLTQFYLSSFYAKSAMPSFCPIVAKEKESRRDLSSVEKCVHNPPSLASLIVLKEGIA
jgi:hypothetical protein